MVFAFQRLHFKIAVTTAEVSTPGKLLVIQRFWIRPLLIYFRSDSVSWAGRLMNHFQSKESVGFLVEPFQGLEPT